MREVCAPTGAGLGKLRGLLGASAPADNNPAKHVASLHTDVVGLTPSGQPRSDFSYETAPQIVSYRTPNRPFRMKSREVRPGLPRFEGNPGLLSANVAADGGAAGHREHGHRVAGEHHAGSRGCQDTGRGWVGQADG